MTWTQDLMDRHRKVLNRLEPHLGCVTCKGPLTDGRCPTCDASLFIDHAVHACISCSPNPSTPGPGCINCRQTGYDQTPCPNCPVDSGSRKRQPKSSDSGSSTQGGER